MFKLADILSYIVSMLCLVLLGILSYAFISFVGANVNDLGNYENEERIEYFSFIFAIILIVIPLGFKDILSKLYVGLATIFRVTPNKTRNFVIVTTANCYVLFIYLMYISELFLFIENNVVPGVISFLTFMIILYTGVLFIRGFYVKKPFLTHEELLIKYNKKKKSDK